MHGLDPNTDLGFLTGQELIQLALGSFEFQLIFTSDIRISVQSMFCLASDHAEGRNLDCGPAAAKELYILLGRKIENWRIGDEGQISLFFEPNVCLTIFDTNALLESYVIWN